jgi:hypothetical protein
VGRLRRRPRPPGRGSRATPETATAGFRRFYRRLGMLTRLAQLLEGRDPWADNLLAIGDQPVLIDLECVLYPRVTPPPGIRHRDLLETYDETVARSGIVVQPRVPRPNLPVRDLGCLLRAGEPPTGTSAFPYRPTVPGAATWLPTPGSTGRTWRPATATCNPRWPPAKTSCAPPWDRWRPSGVSKFAR